MGKRKRQGEINKNKNAGLGRFLVHFLYHVDRWHTVSVCILMTFLRVCVCVCVCVCAVCVAVCGGCLCVQVHDIVCVRHHNTSLTT